MELMIELAMLKEQKKELKKKYLRCKQFTEEKEAIGRMIDDISELIKIKEQQVNEFLETPFETENNENAYGLYF